MQAIFLAPQVTYQICQLMHMNKYKQHESGNKQSKIAWMNRPILLVSNTTLMYPPFQCASCSVIRFVVKVPVSFFYYGGL